MPAWLERRRSSSGKRRRSVQGGKEMEAAVQEEIDYQQTERDIIRCFKAVWSVSLVVFSQAL